MFRIFPFASAFTPVSIDAGKKIWYVNYVFKIIGKTVKNFVLNMSDHITEKTYI